MKEAILSVENLTKIFNIKSDKLFGPPKRLKAVNNVSFEVYEGETVGIIGESGCGKSTLGRSIIRLIEPTSGNVLYKDVSLTKISDNEMKKMRKDIQIIFQDPYSSLDPRKTTGSIIEEPMIIHNMGTAKERKEKVIELLELVGLTKYHATRYPHEFSGGQRQRINIARALSLDPKLIVCDEPVSALDVSVQAQVLNLLKDLQKRLNLTYLFISHDLSVVKYISDRIAIMYLGKIVEIGKSEDIYEKPLHPYTKALFSAIPPENPLEKKQKILLEGEIPSPLNLPPGCPFSSRCPNCVDECKKIVPQLSDVKDGHEVACILYK
ncbi:ABC transporter ATP-binding protein [Abyssisolibacter fermentans]|uniref:ABC transporter ATP-binding protein n=1 Tax=Abyssisolibacter fermentans TaxID=1766203 RepID=UPI000832809A|nr:dipeptide ABC transporter ATP-binding protein [Abyssisolibacter fermentans]